MTGSLTRAQLDDVLELVMLMLATMPGDSDAGVASRASSVLGFRVQLADPYVLARAIVAEGWRPPATLPDV